MDPSPVCPVGEQWILVRLVVNIRQASGRPTSFLLCVWQRLGSSPQRDPGWWCLYWRERQWTVVGAHWGSWLLWVHCWAHLRLLFTIAQRSSWNPEVTTCLLWAVEWLKPSPMTMPWMRWLNILDSAETLSTFNAVLIKFSNLQSFFPCAS